MTQEFVTLPREVVGQALEALNALDAGVKISPNSVLHDRLRAALEQLQDEQPLRYLDGGSRYKVTHMKTSGYCIIGLSRELLGRWVALVDATDNKHMDSYQQPPTTEQSSAVEQPQGEQKPVASLADAIRAEPTELIRKWRVLELIKDHTRPQPKPAMTPIAQRKLDSLLADGYTISGYSVYHEQKHQHGFVTGAGLVGWWKPDGLEYPQPRGEQESFAWINPRALEWGARQSEKVVKLTCEAQPEYDFTEPLYTRPQPKRKPLTDEQIDAIADAMPGGLEGFLKGWGWRQFARAVLENDHDIK